MQDFAFSGLTLSDTISDNISCLECLAQIALLHGACALTSSGRLCVRVPSWSDNTGAESGANRRCTSKYPLCICAQRLALSSCFTAMELDTTHISGPRNGLADWLSRWNGTDALPDGLNPAFRIPLDLPQLWLRTKSVDLFQRIVSWTDECRSWSFCTDLRLCFGPPLSWDIALYSRCFEQAF